MSTRDKLLEKILRGTADTDIPFLGLCNLLKSFGFMVRVRGSHHIYFREGISEIINLQPKGSKAKPYQVRQVRYLILKYALTD